jgi:YVTN family beta-propeller protein
MKIQRILLSLWLALACVAANAASSVLGTITFTNATSLAVDPVLRRAFVSDNKANTVTVVDIDAMSIAATIPVANTPGSMLVDAAAHRVYVLHSDSTGGALEIVDSKANASIGQVPFSGKLWDVKSDFQRGEIYVVTREPNEVQVIDAKAGAVVATIGLADIPGASSINTLLGKLYVPLVQTDAVAVVDEATRKVVRTVSVGRGPLGAYVDAKSAKVFVLNYTDLSASVIDSTSDTMTATIASINPLLQSVFYAPRISPVYDKVYFLEPSLGDIAIFDTNSGYVEKRLAVANPTGLLVDPGVGEIYVPNNPGSSVTIIDARLEKVMGSLSIAGTPRVVTSVVGRLLVLDSSNTLTFATPMGIQANSAIAAEFHHAGFDHYFHTASNPETRVLQDGVFGTAWKATQEFWRVYTAAGPGLVPVCRFFSTGFDPKSSHFYTPYAQECADLKNGNVWHFEEISYYVALPDDTGACKPGFEELYRLYNDGQGGAPNHIYTPSRATRDAMKAKGWIPEGTGPQNVFACTPPLKGWVTSPP